MSRGDRAQPKQLIDHVVGAPQLSGLRSFLATTFELNPDFLEYDFVPSLLGLSQRDDRSTRARLQLEEQLARLDAAAVMMDAECYRSRPCSMRVHLSARRLEAGGKLHAKVAVFVHDDCVRLLVGSANLTTPGYRSNREIAYSLSASAKKPEAARLVSQALTPMEQWLGPWWSDSANVVRNRALALLSQWSSADETGDEERFAWSGPGTPLWRGFAEMWPQGEALERVVIVSPFWSRESEQGPLEGLLRALRERGARTDGAKVELLSNAVASAEGVFLPQAHPSFAEVDFRELGVAATLHAVDPRISDEGFEKDARFRPLHAKLVLACGPATTLAYAGSANFTRRGWGFEAGRLANIEAGIIQRRTGKAARALLALRPATVGAGQPLNGSGTLKQAAQQDWPAAPAWPCFIEQAELRPSAQHEGQLALSVRLGSSEGVTDLSLRTEATAEQTLWSGAPLSSHVIEVELSPQQLRALVLERELHVTWSTNGAIASADFPLNVSAAAREQLPFSSAGGMVGERELVAFYQGRLSFEDLFPGDADDAGSPSEGSLETDGASAVDTSQILSYQVREFVEALPGIRQELGRTAGTVAGIRLAFLGPVSPIALARSIEGAAQAGRSPTAAAFQLLELILCLRQLPVPELSESELTAAWKAAKTECAARLQVAFERLATKAPEVSASRRFAAYQQLLNTLGATP